MKHVVYNVIPTRKEKRLTSSHSNKINPSNKYNLIPINWNLNLIAKSNGRAGIG